MNDPTTATATTTTTAPYGTWRSPITPDLIVGDTVDLEQIALDGDDVYWVESRPNEAGRDVLVRRAADGTTADISPAPFNVRSRVHEYGGGAYAVSGGTVVFSDFADNRLYRRQAATLDEPRPVTPDLPLRFADFVFDHGRDRLIAVREDHRDPAREPVNSLVTIALDGDESGGQILVAGHDFYASPRLSPDGRRLAWLAWNHPNMPWDGCELWIGELAPDGSLTTSTPVAGGPDESIFQPEWTPDGILCFVSDRTGWWNLYRLIDGVARPVWEIEAEFGQPHWVFGQSTYAVPAADLLVGAYRQNGRVQMRTIDLRSGESALVAAASAFTEIVDVRASGRVVVFLGGSPSSPTAIVHLDLDSGEHQVLRDSGSVELDPAIFSQPQPMTFPTENGLNAHAFYYPPTNPDYATPPEALPPLLVESHGGPTSGTSTSLQLDIQFWTSRGFAVLDVDYGGSTGYGRAYRQRLDGQWGVVDVDDCVNGALHLVAQGLADPERLIIRGWSASGYTTLAALAFRDLFRAGASHYGISDLETMTADTHKFESRYLDGLIGRYPEERDRYRERSPIHAVDRITAPLILFQGLDDKVVPPDQAALMFETLRAKGLPVAHVPFVGEGHGFRRAENIKRALDAELSFYAQVFGLMLPDPIEPVTIANLDRITSPR